MPSTIPRVLQPPFSLAQLLSNNAQAINDSSVTLNLGGSTIASVIIPPITADSILWVIGEAEIAGGPSATNLQLHITALDTVVPAEIDWFGSPGLFPRMLVPPAPSGVNTVLNISGIGFAPVDMPAPLVDLGGFSGGDDSMVAAGNGALRVFIIRA